MIILDEQKKRGVGITRTLWPRVNGILTIPYDFDSSSK